MSVTVRMYDVGFGDCFLIRSDDPPWRMLVDCGCHLSSSPSHGGTISDVARAVIEDCRDPVDGVPRIDVVVISHRHYDHIAGFDVPDWGAVEVQEVWLPWTENLSDPAAKKIHDAQTSLAARLTALAGRSPRWAVARELLELSNAGAMTTLHGGFAKHVHPRFLAGDLGAAPIVTPALPGARVHVLGPSRDPKTIRDMDPPKGQSYLAIFGPALGGEPPLLPFGSSGLELPDKPRPAWVRAIDRAVEENLTDLAAALADSVNGTSLVLMLEVGASRLLLAGDAQWGTWRTILADASWKQLVASTTFLKVGHHGSHNATPKILIDDTLPDGIPAMVSVRHVDKFPEVPKCELLHRFGEKSIAVIRSDGQDLPQLADLTVAPDQRYFDLVLPT